MDVQSCLCNFWIIYCESQWSGAMFHSTNNRLSSSELFSTSIWCRFQSSLETIFIKYLRMNGYPQMKFRAQRNSNVPAAVRSTFETKTESLEPAFGWLMIANGDAACCGDAEWIKRWSLSNLNNAAELARASVRWGGGAETLVIGVRLRARHCARDKATTASRCCSPSVWNASRMSCSPLKLMMNARYASIRLQTFTRSNMIFVLQTFLLWITSGKYSSGTVHLLFLPFGTSNHPTCNHYVISVEFAESFRKNHFKVVPHLPCRYLDEIGIRSDSQILSQSQKRIELWIFWK